MQSKELSYEEEKYSPASLSHNRNSNMVQPVDTQALDKSTCSGTASPEMLLQLLMH